MLCLVVCFDLRFNGNECESLPPWVQEEMTIEAISAWYRMTGESLQIRVIQSFRT